MGWTFADRDVEIIDEGGDVLASRLRGASNTIKPPRRIGDVACSSEHYPSPTEKPVQLARCRCALASLRAAATAMKKAAARQEQRLSFCFFDRPDPPQIRSAERNL
jgi:hypothetical protein